jgi:hypothetical protein
MAEQQDLPLSDAKPVTVGDDEEFVDEEIDLPLEEGEEVEAKNEEPEEPPKEKKKRGPKRMSALAHERDEARNYAAQLEAELRQERLRASGLETKAAEASNIAMQSFASKSESDLKEARSAYSSALQSGDPDRITQAAEQLSSAKATMDDIDAWKKTESAKPATKTPVAEEPAATRPAEKFQDLPENIKNWASENRWWDVNARDDSGDLVLDRGGRPTKNPDFDEEMHVEATMYATKIERQIASGKLKFKVASPEYFGAIEEHMSKEFPDFFGEGEEDEAPAPPPRKASPVAGPSRTVPTTTRNGSVKKGTITGDEIRFVRKMVDNNGGPRYPKGHPKQFEPMTFEDAKVSFLRQKTIQAQNK